MTSFPVHGNKQMTLFTGLLRPIPEVKQESKHEGLGFGEEQICQIEIEGIGTAV